MTAEDTFRLKAPGIALKLMGDFPIGRLDACAILGNCGYECNGFTTLQEISPTVKGSRGGYGWPQWTGARRRAYEAYCKRNVLDPASDKANYAFLFLELKGPERRAIAAVKAALTLDEKVEAFERAFLRAGVKHYASRKRWAAIANEVVPANLAPAPTPMPERIAVLRQAEADMVQRQERATAAIAGTATGSVASGMAAGAAAVSGNGPDIGVLVGLGATALIFVAALGLALWVARRQAATARALTQAIEG